MLATLALITLDFDPLLRLGGLTIRWQTIGVTVALLIALSVAALMAPDVRAQRPFFRRGGRGRTDLGTLYPDAPKLDATSSPDSSGRSRRLDDMLLIIAGIVPGAVAGGASSTASSTGTPTRPRHSGCSTPPRARCRCSARSSAGCSPPPTWRGCSVRRCAAGLTPRLCPC